MTYAEIELGFRKTVDQYYAYLPYMNDKYREESELFYIGGILQAALHILPLSKYELLKRYIYDRHGYDPGGVTTGQMTITEFMEGRYEK